MSNSVIQRQLPRPHPGVIFNTVSSGAVLLHAPTEIYFGLNAVGSRVWQLLPPECESFEELCNRLMLEYPDVPAEQIAEDVAELLNALENQGLVVSP